MMRSRYSRLVSVMKICPNLSLATNPASKIVWIVPGSELWPELEEDAVRLAREEGMTGLYTFALPDYGEEDLGSRFHPNAEWTRKAGLLLADYLRREVL